MGGDHLWEAIGAVGELLGALAVFVSLVYLAIQVRGNSALIRMQGLNAQTNHLQSFADLQAKPELQEALRKVFRNNALVSDQEGVYMESYTLSVLAITRNDYYKHRFGYSTEADWIAATNLVGELFVADWPRAWWNERGRRVFESDFADAIDDIIAKSPGFKDTISAIGSGKSPGA